MFRKLWLAPSLLLFVSTAVFVFRALCAQSWHIERVHITIHAHHECAPVPPQIKHIAYCVCLYIQNVRRGTPSQKSITIIVKIN